MPFQKRPDSRRRAVLSLMSEIENGLRDLYEIRYEQGVTQSSIAEKLGVNKSVVHHRLTGKKNMTAETIAEMVWALGGKIKVNIFDPATIHGMNHFVSATPAAQSAAPLGQSAVPLTSGNPRPVECVPGIPKIPAMATS